MSNFDLTGLAVSSVFPTNKVITDDKGLPSVMVYIPKFKMSDVITGGSNSVHPAFIVDGVEKNGIYISKYQNKVYDGRAYSLPGEDPTTGINLDNSIARCTAKGAGWHLMTAMEWGAIALWCKKNGWLPYGNNNYGKDTRESLYKAVPTLYGSDGKINRVATGTGPVEWSHNKQLDGIYDLNGNVNEWVGGMRLVKGELQILENNNAANGSNSQTATSAQWKAIDGTTGELITPNGTGTTENSLKLDYVSSKWKWITGTISAQADEYKSCTFVNVSADDNVCAEAKELLYALVMLPDDTSFNYESDYFYANNGNAERSPSRGGGWSHGAAAGVFYARLTYGRTAANSSLGFRSAFYD